MTSRIQSVDLNLLRAFLAVADAGRISVAAPRLNLSQPAVTAQIRKLESEVGIDLFVRSARGVSLTSEGVVFKEEIANILAAVEAALDRTTRRAVSGNLKLASSTTFASYIFPRLYADFQALYPGLTANLWASNTDAILERVRLGQARLGIVEGLAHAGGLRLEPFMRDDLIAVGSKKLHQRIKRIADLKGTPILWREQGSGTRAVVERGLRKIGFEKADLTFDFEVGSTEAIKGLASEGAGVAFLPRSSLKNEFALGYLQPILESELRIERRFYWVQASGGLDSTHHTFKTFVEDSTRGSESAHAKRGKKTR